MDTPKPTPKPVNGISLHPPRPAGTPAPRPPASRTSGPAAPRTPAKRPLAPETIKVVHPKAANVARRDLPRPGGFRLFLGFLAALLGGTAIAYYPEPFLLILESVLIKLHMFNEAGLQGFSMHVTKSAVVDANQWIHTYGYIARWTPQIVGVLCLLFAGWCLKKRIGFFLAAAGAICVTIGALAAAYDWFIPPHCMALPAVGLAYLIQAGPNPAAITIRGIFGFGFVAVSLLGLVLGVFFLPRWGGHADAIAAQISQSGPAYLWAQPAQATPVYFLSAAFVDQWKDVVLWGAVLLTASIGAVVCRDKLLRFLSACLFSTLAVLLFKSAHIEWNFFPGLGVNVPPQPDWSYSNIQIWQWLILAELVIVAAVLIYKSVGAGGLTVAIALVWLCCSLHVDTYAGRLTAYRMFSPAAADFVSAQSRPQEADEGYDKATARGLSKATGPISSGLHMEVASADIAGAAAPLGWFYLTCFSIGIIVVSGLRMLIRCPEARTWVMCLLWLVFAVFGAYLYWHWPSSGKLDLQGVVMTLTTHPIHRKVALALAVGAAAFFGTWALRWNSRYHTWLYTAATAVFIATLLSFIALAVMIRWGGFGALPVQSYIVLAVGQSALMWVLLLHANFVHPEPAAATAPAPGSPRRA